MRGKRSTETRRCDLHLLHTYMREQELPTAQERESRRDVGGRTHVDLLRGNTRFEIRAIAANHAYAFGPEAIAGLHEFQEQHAVPLPEGEHERLAVIHRGLVPFERKRRIGEQAAQLPDRPGAGSLREALSGEQQEHTEDAGAHEYGTLCADRHPSKFPATKLSRSQRPVKWICPHSRSRRSGPRAIPTASSSIR